MSRDSNGNYNLPAGNPVIAGTVITTSWANPTMSDIGAALTDSLSRSGKGGMGAILTMGGFKVSGLGAGALATDAPQAAQVRDSVFTVLNPCTSDSTGNNYGGVALLSTPPVAGTLYMFTADKNNTGPMTLSVNGGAALPILIHGSPVTGGLILTGSVIQVVYSAGLWRLANTAGVVGTINSVQSDSPNMISVTNNTIDGVATLNIHAGAANGICQLDSSIKVPIAQLPFTALFYIGNWNAGPGTNPVAAAQPGQFYVITGAGNLTVYRFNTGTNTYVPQVTACAVGDQIVYNTIGTVSQPVGWYYVPASGAPLPASLVTLTPTPTFPTATDVQAWANQADPAINGKLSKTGGTMSGAIIQPIPPATGQALANKQYVDDSIAGLPPAVASFNTRTGAVTLLSTDVTNALAYTPANTTGQVFTGPVQATAVSSTGVMFAKGYNQTINSSSHTGSFAVDYTTAQSQIITLTGNSTISAITNIPIGTILRLTLLGTNFTLAWPSNVHWPLGSAPDLSLGPLKKAVVVLENDGATLLATFSVY